MYEQYCRNIVYLNLLSITRTTVSLSRHTDKWSLTNAPDLMNFASYLLLLLLLLNIIFIYFEYNSPLQLITAAVTFTTTTSLITTTFHSQRPIKFVAIEYDNICSYSQFSY